MMDGLLPIALGPICVAEDTVRPTNKVSFAFRCEEVDRVGCGFFRLVLA